MQSDVSHCFDRRCSDILKCPQGTTSKTGLTATANSIFQKFSTNTGVRECVIASVDMNESALVHFLEHMKEQCNFRQYQCYLIFHSRPHCLSDLWLFLFANLSFSFSGMVVTNGLRFYYDKPRKYDAGALSVGDSANCALTIPPNQENWIVSGGCTRDCSSVSIAQSSNL